MNKEEIKNKLDEMMSYLSKENISREDEIYTNFVVDLQKAKNYIEQLENKVKEQEELNNKYLQKLVYALTPTTHELSTSYNEKFKKIIAENIDLETCKIKRLLKECWGIDKY